MPILTRSVSGDCILFKFRFVLIGVLDFCFWYGKELNQEKENNFLNNFLSFWSYFPLTQPSLRDWKSRPHSTTHWDYWRAAPPPSRVILQKPTLSSNTLKVVLQKPSELSNAAFNTTLRRLKTSDWRPIGISILLRRRHLQLHRRPTSKGRLLFQLGYCLFKNQLNYHLSA